MTPNWMRRVRAIAGALLLGLIAATSSWAQNYFYQEVVKDGRIYVFASGKEYEAWSKSGEMGKALTRLGYGPNAETMIFDSEDAIGLYNFKHGRPGDVGAIPAPVKKPKMEVTWKDGKTTIATDKAQLQISNRVQSRWTQELPDDKVTLSGTKAAGDGKGSFRIRRAKTKFEGWAYFKELTYEVQLNWPDVTGTPASRFMEDAWLNWDVSKDKKFQVKFGQFKVPFGRQELTSSGAQQFVDRSDVSLRYARGRETGLQAWGQLAGGKLEWRAGAFNGNGRSQSANDNDKYQYNARVTFAPSGDPKYSDSDFESTDKLLWALGVEFEHNDKFRSTTNVDTKDRILGFDGIFKYKGFSTFGEYFMKKATPETGAKFDDKGFYVQTGYLFDKAKRWELAFRYGQIDPSDLKSDNKLKEIGGALNYYRSKHNLKIQADYRNLKNEATDVSNNEIRVQAQIIF